MTGIDAATYDPANYVIERPREWDTSKYLSLPRVYVHAGTGGKHILAMFYKIKACNKMKQQAEIDGGFKYDVVVRTRFDLVLFAPVRFSELTELDKAVYVFSRPAYVPVEPSNNMIDQQCRAVSDGRTAVGSPALADFFAVGSSDNMDYYASLYDRIDDLTAKYGVFAPESLLYQHLWEHPNKWRYLEVGNGLQRHGWVQELT